MPKILRFTQFSFKDFYATAGPALLLIALFCLFAYWLIDPMPPRVMVMSTGQENGAYAEFGKKYAAALARHGIKLELRTSLGSQENFLRLRAEDESIDAAFVQSGSAEADDARQKGLVSLGSLFVEPVWIFYRQPLALQSMADLKGLRVNIGQEGTGVPGLFWQLLAANGLSESDLRPSMLDNTPATVELLEERIDALVFSSAPDAPLVQMLLQTPGISLFGFNQAEAYSRRFSFLSHVTLPRGIVDLGRNIPDSDYHLIAPMATLVIKEDLHPALIDLMVQAAASIHGGAGWFQKEGELPTARYAEIPVAGQAARFYRDGPPFLQRYMPYWLANFFSRMWVVIVAVAALMLPMMRIVPPLYVWKVRSRVYRWYGQLRKVEQAIEAVAPDQRATVYQAQLRRLNEIDENVNRISIPLSFAEELYGLRSHIDLVRSRIAGLMRA